MRPDEHILFNYNFSIAGGPSGARIKMGDNRRSESDDAIIANADICGMNFIDIHKLANPDVLSDGDSAQPLQPRSYAETSGRHKGDLAGKPTEQNWQSQQLLPL